MDRAGSWQGVDCHDVLSRGLRVWIFHAFGYHRWAMRLVWGLRRQETRHSMTQWMIAALVGGCAHRNGLGGVARACRRVRPTPSLARSCGLLGFSNQSKHDSRLLFGRQPWGRWIDLF